MLDERGHPDFDRLQRRARTRWEGSGHIVYCVFDLTMVAGIDIRPRPLEMRRSILERLWPGPVPHLLLVHAVRGHGEALYRQVVALELEGIVAKRCGSPYVPGRSRDWIKFKRPGAPCRRSGSGIRDPAASSGSVRRIKEARAERGAATQCVARAVSPPDELSFKFHCPCPLAPRSTVGLPRDAAVRREPPADARCAARSVHTLIARQGN
ncbi:hypothetical protein [Aquabacterium sp. A7-Y]|uniref:ATP-dependent DNA ligase n=1 Tax=Aquabacterium sp. A7-Y TaxID=1349605 RepID=UPI0039FD2358